MRGFDRLAAVGHRARELGDFEAASKSFTEALAIWRGRALVDVQTGSLLEVEAHRLEEARLNVLDRRIDADLRLGRHHEMVEASRPGPLHWLTRWFTEAPTPSGGR